MVISGVELKPTKGFYGFDCFLEREKFYGHEVSIIASKLITALPTDPDNPTGGGGGCSNCPNTPPQIYVPQAISGTVNVVGSSYSFNWNSDNLNTNGVVIVAEYSPGLYTNQGISLHTPLRRSIIVPDNGSYTIDASWFANFPGNSTIVLYIGRGNYTLINQGDILVGTYTANAVFSFLMPAQ